jgi:hypothetical protein
LFNKKQIPVYKKIHCSKLKLNLHFFWK